jgi:hypothetical protein
MLFVGILALILTAAMWWMGEWEFRTKLILTLIYFGTWLLVLVNPYLVLAAQALYCVVVGYGTFGSSFAKG